MNLTGKRVIGQNGVACSRKPGWWLALLILLSVFGVGTTAPATIYYIDFDNGSDTASGTSKMAPWKVAPGMSGFAGAYSHRSGDVFIFKGGVTWPSAVLPMDIGGSGAPGTTDTYTTDHTWFSGASWSQPILDGGGSGTPLITGLNCGFITINDFRLQNVGVAYQTDPFKAVQFGDCHDLALTNNTITPYSWIGVLIYGANGTTQNNMSIQNNDISNVVTGVVVGTAGANTVLNNVTVSGNQIHDLASKIGGGVHGDGIHFWSRRGDASQYIQNGRIYNNRFYGSFARSFGSEGAMTALIYLENVRSTYLIYNNVLSYADVLGSAEFEALMLLVADPGSTAGVQIYNNSVRGTNPGMSAGLLLMNVPNATIQNNIFSGMKYCYYIDPGSTSGTVIDYNDMNCTDIWAPPGIWGSTFVYGFGLWQALGNDTHGIDANPLWPPSASDLLPQAGSPVIGAGANLSGVFSTDAIGNPRPSTGPWTLGAYEPVAGTP